MSPKSIKITDKTDLRVRWSDESESIINLKYLRDQCPCAGCKGETILLRTYRPPKPQMASPEMYKVRSIDPVGGYAVQIAWKDGHNTGIYTFDYLRQLAEDQASGAPHDYEPLL